MGELHACVVVLAMQESQVLLLSELRSNQLSSPESVDLN
jgi:hypothetical protein